MEVFVNLTSATLASGINTSDTSLPLTTGHGARFGTITAGDKIRIAFLDATRNVTEIAYMTAISGDTATITRGQDGTSGTAHLAGDTIEARIGKSTMEAFTQKIKAGTDAIAETVAATSKAAPVDADILPIADSAASNVLKRLTWANIKATLKAYFDTLYAFSSLVAPGGNLTGAMNEARGTVAIHATTMDIWTGKPAILDVTGTALTITDIADAPQAGARRTIYLPAGTILTNNANIAVSRGANYTINAGDKTEIEAVTVSTFKAHISVVGEAYASAAENIAGTIENKAVDPLGVREAFNVTGTAPVYACRAKINFNGTGTVVVREAGNMTVTDNGVGDYTVNITSALPTANPIISVNGAQNTTGGSFVGHAHGGTYTASAVRISTANSVFTPTDMQFVDVIIF